MEKKAVRQILVGFEAVGLFVMLFESPQLCQMWTRADGQPWHPGIVSLHEMVMAVEN